MQRAIRSMDIWMVSLTETLGSEQRGQRPAIVISVQPETNVSMVVPLTSNLGALRLPFSYKISRTTGNGLEADSVALVFQMRSLTMSAGRFLFKMGSVDKEHFKNIKALIKNYLQID